ncbi:uncharacterized protein LOC124328560 [Daphnia pulicaria]|uniref:uncharacterized protein LOC124328560 n=1 Tax=Daphnia pulicaria TaxID=35523 RepID=UPI001EEAA852|nr:uncharacterized protein LOC124328560 [Daphnia pulicaria]
MGPRLGPLRKTGYPNIKFKTKCNLLKHSAHYVPLGICACQIMNRRRKSPGILKRRILKINKMRLAENKKTAKHVKKKKGTSKANVQFGLVNAHSLLNKADDLEEQIVRFKLDIVAVTETWFVDDSDMKEACPEGFKGVHEPRSDGHGGVAIYYRDYIKRSVKPLKDYDSFEYIDVTLTISPRDKMTLIVIYRPAGSKADFREEFEEFLDSVKRRENLMIVGDFNLPYEDNVDREFMKIIQSHGLKQHVKDPTHVNGGILDLILSRPSDSLVKNVRVGDLFSDHKFVRCRIEIN